MNVLYLFYVGVCGSYRESRRLISTQLCTKGVSGAERKVGGCGRAVTASRASVTAARLKRRTENSGGTELSK